MATPLLVETEAFLLSVPCFSSSIQVVKAISPAFSYATMISLLSSPSLSVFSKIIANYKKRTKTMREKDNTVVGPPKN